MAKNGVTASSEGNVQEAGQPAHVMDIDEKGQGARARGRGPLVSSRTLELGARAELNPQNQQGENAGQVLEGNPHVEVGRNAALAAVTPRPAAGAPADGAHSLLGQPGAVMGSEKTAGGGGRKSFEVVGTMANARQGYTSASVTHGERKDKNVVAAIKALTRTTQEDVDGKRDPLDTGIVLQFRDVEFHKPVRLWSKLIYGVTRRLPSGDGMRRRLLHNVSGTVRPGQFMAIMGPEGAGKTLFLQVLAGRVPGYQGKITYNGAPYTKRLTQKVGYVSLEVEALQSKLTVKEMLLYAARLRMPQKTEDLDRIVRMEHVIDSMDLQSCANVLVGRALTNERLRLLIAVEMVMNPTLLLLDEPTSGLDGALALRLTRTLAAYAATGRTVIATMKQPSNRVFSMFDLVLLLAQGNPLYMGSAPEALPYFASIGHIPSAGVSPAEYLLDLAVSEPSDGSIHFGTTVNLMRKWAKRQEEEQKHEKDEPSPVVPAGAGEPRWQTSWWFQFRTLLARGFKASQIDWYTRVQFASVIFQALLIGCYWYKRDDSYDGLRDQAGLLFFSTFYWSLIPMLTSTVLINQVKPLLAREQAGGMYHISAWLCHHLVLEWPYEIGAPIIFCCITYWMVDLNPGFGQFVVHTLLTVLNTMVASGLGLAVGAFWGEIKTGVLTGCLLILASLMVTPFFSRFPPLWIGWCQYLSFTTYTYKLFLRLNFDEHQTYRCAQPPLFECSVHQHPELTGFDNIAGGGSVEAVILIFMFLLYRFIAYVLLRHKYR